MLTKSVVFESPWKVAFKETEIDENLGPKDILVDTEYSIISAGTEMAILSGNEFWAPLPFVPGYGSIGKIRAMGNEVYGFQIGDRIFHYGKHQATTKATGLILHVPQDLSPLQAVMARMGQVAFTAIRVSDAELGDTAAVIGLGTIGNLAAQLLALSGCTVIGVDLSDRRLETARQCGVHHTINSSKTDPVEEVRRITNGAMCEIIVEATGVPDVVATAVKMASHHGEAILLGSPRGQFTGNAMDILNAVHVWGRGTMTLKGAHEWRFPVYHDYGGSAKHSLERNVRQLFQMIHLGRLHVDELISHVVKPETCVETYEKICNRDESMLGVVFDWTK